MHFNMSGFFSEAFMRTGGDLIKDPHSRKVQVVANSVSFNAKTANAFSSYVTGCMFFLENIWSRLNYGTVKFSTSGFDILRSVILSSVVR